MSNIFVKIGIGVADFGKWLAKAVTDTVKLAVKVETVLKAEEPLAAPFISGISTVISDVEALVAASSTALTAEGLNIPADSKVYQEMVTLISDFGKLAPIVEEAVSILEGKTTTATVTPAATTATTATTATAATAATAATK
jgi:hypothetical protein